MTQRSMLLTLCAAAASLAPAAARGADLSPAVVSSLAGSLQIQQEAPCNNTIVLTTPLTAGRLRLTPAEGVAVSGGTRFALAGADLAFHGFSVSGSCGIFSDTRTYSDISIRLARAVSFVATPGSGGALAITIPKDDVLIAEQAVVNGSPEVNYFTASQDVTGTIDLVHAAMSLRFVASATTHFQAGCTPAGCIIDEFKPGTFTANVSGTIVFPDSDGDGVPDRSDNCRFVANTDQTPVATPTIAAPAPLTFASCADHAIGIAHGADVCDGGPVTVTSDAPAIFAVGANTVTWTATDASGRSASAMQTITIADTTKPTFTSVPLDVTAGNCGPVPLGTATAIDDCAGAPSIINDAPSTFGVGETVVTWIATDESGNQSAAAQKVIVTDTVAPAAACVASSPLGHEFVVSSGDACGTAIIRLGTYVLANGERIKVHETAQSGVTFVGVVGPDAIRHFLVGPGQAVITATDPSGNVTTAACR